MSIEDLPVGPADYLEIYQFANVLLAALTDLPTVGWQLAGPVERLRGKTVVMTTSYSGLGSAEWSMKFVQQAFSTAGGGFEVEFYSATDNSKACRSALEAHREPPKHIFGDLRDRIPTEVYGQLEGLFTKFNDMMPKGECKKVVTQAAKDLGDLFFQEACTLLDNLELPRDGTAWCFLCEKNCPVVPPLRPGDIWLEAAGNTCTPWSRSGAQLGWLDFQSLVSLVWGYWLRSARPSVILNECTPMWPAGLFFGRIMGDSYITQTLKVCD
jgi:hypothetical protein